MKIPAVPNVGPLAAMTPSLYDSTLLCKARGAWQAFGKGAALPSHPSALLGQAYHRVMQAAVAGTLGTCYEEREASARELFDSFTYDLYLRAHPLIRAKFLSTELLPYYGVYRERAAQKAAALAAGHSPATGGAATSDGRIQAGAIVERELVSSDGVLKGRPDFVDPSHEIVVDYKSGGGLNLNDAEITDGERRQLLLYAYLLRDNGVAINSGAIERADGRTAKITISQLDAEREASGARTLLTEFNQAALSKSFESLASPSPSSCRGCRCIPVCEEWNKGDEGWADVAGSHAEGVVNKLNVLSFGGTDIVTMVFDITRGTIPRGEAALEQVPLAWLTFDGSEPPQIGARVRIVDARLASVNPLVLRTDKVMTAVWSLI